ncbi:hypothetical protein I0Q12_01875 [Rhodococcus sp. CX]|uniref:hypothetical protein n=1 Tax=Rhodococcus sp. CX TaxID=2789880 RepID=UPI0018CE5DDC|nr:hypothetical protein [Rhodococcus sp. CX]MBH0118350.1 hypothetical protein [Rhodococcus sp. CX]
MNATDMAVLHQVGVQTLVAHSHRLGDTGKTGRAGSRHESPRAESRELGRLEELGLIAFCAPGRGNEGVKLTSAGVEILAYLAGTG